MNVLMLICRGSDIPPDQLRHAQGIVRFARRMLFGIPIILLFTFGLLVTGLRNVAGWGVIALILAVWLVFNCVIIAVVAVRGKALVM